MHGHLNIKFAMSEFKDTRSAAQNAEKASVLVFIGLRRRLWWKICRDIQVTWCAWWRGGNEDIAKKDLYTDCFVPFSMLLYVL